MNWAMFNYMMEEDPQDKGVEVKKSHWVEVELRREASGRRQRVSVASSVGCLPTDNPLFLFPIPRCPATGLSKPFMEMPSSLPVSSLRMNMWLYFGQWDVRGWSSWKAPLLDERRGHERRAWERGMRGDPFSFCALSSCLGGHDTWCQIIHFVITRGTSLSRLSMEKAWVIREMVE